MWASGCSCRSGSARCSSGRLPKRSPTTRRSGVRIAPEGREHLRGDQQPHIDLSRFDRRLQQLSVQHEMGRLTDAEYDARAIAADRERAAAAEHSASFDLDAALANVEHFGVLLHEEADERAYQTLLEGVTVRSKTEYQVAVREDYFPLFAAHHLRAYGTGCLVVAPTGDAMTSALPPLEVEFWTSEVLEHG